jgi:hypothetical protein
MNVYNLKTTMKDKEGGGGVLFVLAENKEGTSFLARIVKDIFLRRKHMKA